MSIGAATEQQRERAEGDVDSIGMSYLSLVDLGCELKVLQLRDAHLGGGVAHTKEKSAHAWAQGRGQGVR